MIDILRTLSIVSCFVSGIYSFAMYFYFSKSKSTFWYGWICITLGLNIGLSLMYGGHNLYIPAEGLTGNIYLLGCAFLAGSINMYASTTNTFTKLKHLKAYTTVCLLVALLGFAMPSDLFYVAYYVIYSFTIISCCMAVISFFILRDKPESFLFQSIAYISLTVNRVFGVLPNRSNNIVITTRLICVLIFIICSLLAITQNYRTSIKRTKMLSNSLVETIASINHSDNALMCTQMKADFLYKSLDLISEKCDDDPWTAEDLTISLSKYLRHTLNFQQLKGIVPISNEIELTKAYIAIERERYPFISFEYYFPNPMPEFHVPPLSIQPIVENAIEHAFKVKKDKARIAITILAFRDYYHIDISDNGDGMDEDFSETLTESLHESARIGIYNIHTRLLNLFGKGIVVQSAPGVGTSVSFVVPPNAGDYIDKEDEK